MKQNWVPNTLNGIICTVAHLASISNPSESVLNIPPQRVATGTANPVHMKSRHEMNLGAKHRKLTSYAPLPISASISIHLSQCQTFHHSGFYRLHVYEIAARNETERHSTRWIHFICVVAHFSRHIKSVWVGVRLSTTIVCNAHCRLDTYEIEAWIETNCDALDVDSAFSKVFNRFMELSFSSLESWVRVRAANLSKKRKKREGGGTMSKRKEEEERSGVFCTGVPSIFLWSPRVTNIFPPFVFNVFSVRSVFRLIARFVSSIVFCKLGDLSSEVWGFLVIHFIPTNGLGAMSVSMLLCGLIFRVRAVSGDWKIR